MTTKTYAITEEQRDEILNALSISDYANDGEHVSATEPLQSLPLITGEPVAYMFKTNEGTERWWL